MDDATIASWVFLAVQAADSTDSRGLNHVIAAGDALNHAVLGRDEIELGVQILEGLGLVEPSGPIIAVTEAGQAELEAVNSRSWHAMWDRLALRLSELGTDNRSAWVLPEEAFQSALRTYRRRG